MSGERTSRLRAAAVGFAVIFGVLAIVVGEVLYTRPVRDAVGAYTSLLGVANQNYAKDEARLAAARSLCSSRYLQSHELKVAPEGGLVGIPRNIHKNYQAWRHGDNVWICPTNRVGPIYQFVFESDTWRFDGPVGLLLPHWEVVPYVETSGDPPDSP